MEMNIEQALSRIKWRVENSWANPQDVQAFNTVLEHVELSNKAITTDQILFSKLLLAVIRSKADSGEHTVQGILSEVETVLQKPLYTALEEFKDQVPLFKFELIAHKGCEGLDPIKDFAKIKRIRESNLRANKAALVSALKTSWSVDQAISFLESQVAKLTNQYAGQP